MENIKTVNMAELEEFVDKLYDQCQELAGYVIKARDAGNKEEVEVWERHYDKAVARWGTAHNILRWVNGEVEGEELKEI